MRSYTQLTENERYQIYALMKAGNVQAEIARQLGRSRSTINRELTRNSHVSGYDPKTADRLAKKRRGNKQAAQIESDVWVCVREQLKEQWSPEQISGWLQREQGKSISHEWIYQHVYADKRAGGDLYRQLRCQKQRRKRYGSHDRRGQIKDRVSIDERPTVVEERARVGDWEVDTVIGNPGGSVLVTVVERKSKFSVLALSPDKSASSVRKVLVSALMPYKDKVHTMTYDNGKKFSHHKVISTALDASGYFAHPYHSWERGLNENTNGLIRQYLPKKSSFDDIGNHEINKIMRKLNNRPRKTLDFKTPSSVFLS